MIARFTSRTLLGSFTPYALSLHLQKPPQSGVARSSRTTDQAAEDQEAGTKSRPTHTAPNSYVRLHDQLHPIMNYDPIHDTFAGREPDTMAASDSGDSSSSPTKPHQSEGPGQAGAPAPSGVVGVAPQVSGPSGLISQGSSQNSHVLDGAVGQAPLSTETTSASTSSQPEPLHGPTQTEPPAGQPSSQAPAARPPQAVPATAGVGAYVGYAEREVRPSADATPEPHDESEDERPPLGTLPASFRSLSRGFKHLKKADGEPFWRKDIQYAFLEQLFADDTAVFTNHFPYCEVPHAANGPKLTFAQLYVRTLAESLKLSKVLRERLIKDHDMGVAVSKVCLLVNAGRMNTTVNFVPDMRSALRTYHLIPLLQADPDGPSKPLQDTPRLKTILKAVCDGHDHLQTLLDLLRAPPITKPNTSVIKLIFLMSTFFQNIPFHYDDLYDHDLFLDKLRFIKALPGPQNKFMEFFLNDEIRPENRARRFLWLMYTYLETSFTAPELAANPFHPALIPPLEYIPPAELPSYDVDPDYEIEYAAKMYHARMLHLHGDDAKKPPAPKPKKDRARARPDDTDDLADDTLPPDDDPVDELPAPEELRLKSVKRKKPTPLVGSLVDDSKRPFDAEARWLDPQFPLAARARLARFAPCTVGVPVAPLARDSATCVARRKAVASKSRAFVSHMARASPDFDAARAAAERALRRYFQYKKARDGLVALEWEAVRSDVALGVESYLYQQMGKLLVMRHYDEQLEDEREHGEPELLKRSSFVTSSETLPGDSAPVDVAQIDEVGAGHAPVHDYDHAGERTTYELLLITMVNETIAQNAGLWPKRTRVAFDLDDETAVFV